MENEKPKETLPPFTLEEAEKTLLWLENIAINERDLGFGTRLVLMNLLKALTAAKVIDGKTFIDDLRAGLPQIERASDRLGAEAVLADMQAVVLRTADIDPKVH